MPYVPQNAKWYVAEIIEEITVEDDPRNIVHRNLVLIHGDSPDDAYAKALEIGQQHGGAYTNPGGRLVNASFRGLGYLDVVHDELEHGAELLFERRTAVPEEEIQRWILTREQLPLFREPEPLPDYPDYGSNEILEEAKAVSEFRTNDSRIS